MYPKVLNDLIESFKKLPGIGEKTAERLSFSLLSFADEDIALFSDSISNLKKIIKPCKNCGMLTDSDTCFVCRDVTRDKEELIVVEDSKDAFLFEKLGNFKGYYHVLGGFISPSDGILPDDINLKSLVKRVDENGVKEIILAIKSSIEADTTSLYIKKMLEGKNVKITKIASGIPIGAEMDYVDALTLEQALKNRLELNNKK